MISLEHCDIGHWWQNTIGFIIDMLNTHLKHQREYQRKGQSWTTGRKSGGNGKMKRESNWWRRLVGGRQ
jgi:hypothetical protein